MAILLFLTAAACNKDDDTSPADQLPPITMEGKGTFACLINGEVWKWKGRNPWNGFPNLDTYYFEPNNGLSIQAIHKSNSNNSEIHQTMNISTKVKNGPTKYPLTRKERVFIDYFPSNLSCAVYNLDTTKTNSISILKLDINNKIISGTFEFTIFNECDTLRITEGRFDDFYRE